MINKSINYNGLILLIIAFLSMVSCKQTKHLSMFTIGKGGGFTGKYEEYLVKSNGDVYSTDNENKSVLLKKINKTTSQDIFEKFNALKIENIVFSHPGNMTSYLRFEKDGKIYEIKWGDFKIKPPQNVMSFFDEVWNLIRQKND